MGCPLSWGPVAWLMWWSTKPVCNLSHWSVVAMSVQSRVVCSGARREVVITTYCAISSVHLVFGRACRRWGLPAWCDWGFHVMACWLHLWFSFATFAAHCHLRRLCILDQSSICNLRRCLSASCVVLLIHSTQGSKSSFCSSSGSGGCATCSGLMLSTSDWSDPMQLSVLSPLLFGICSSMGPDWVVGWCCPGDGCLGCWLRDWCSNCCCSCCLWNG